MIMSAQWREQVNQIRARLALQESLLSAQTIAAAVSSELPLLGNAEKLEVFDELVTHIDGLGPLDRLSKQPGVTDILVNGFSDVWFDDGHGLRRANIAWNSESELRDFVGHLANQASRRLDEVQPFLDAHLPSGIRLHAVIPPLSTVGTCLSLRIPQQISLSLTDLQLANMFDDQVLGILRKIVYSGLPFVISGGTGSGKTTLLSALLSEVPHDERLLIIEDTHELKVDHPHAVGLQARNSNSEGAGEVTLRTLVRQALRMRPDRVILGEVRGAEIVDLVTALNTGHTGGCTTIHANSANDVPARVASLGLLAGIPVVAMNNLFATAIKVIIELVQIKDGTRKVAGFHLIEEFEGITRVTQAVDQLGMHCDEQTQIKFHELLEQKCR
ncbi:MAG: TadA family conjugal transfer-associated ATPase [Actinobacteria bacterium]|nr:TadA family conjugal transfer-associated ATPase [Actinomycetota bacterium]